MYQYVTFSDFVDAFHGHDRDNQFSYEGKKALFDYFNEFEESSGEEIELDVIAICCEWTEYDNATDAASEYPMFEGMVFDENGDETETADDVEKKALAFLEDRTTVLRLPNGGVVINEF